MVYQSEHMTLRSVREVYRGKVNDVLICRDERTAAGSYYTVWVIHCHDTAKQLLRVFEQSEKGRKGYVETFSASGGFCVVFDYEKERYLENFYQERDFSLYDCEMVCRNLIVACIASPLPFPLLYLALSQGQLHLDQDGGVRLGCFLNLEELRPACSEKDCAVQCALIVRKLLEGRATKKTISYQILLKKIPKKSYASFQELYTDIRLTSVKPGKKKWKSFFRNLFYKNQGWIFKLLLWISGILALVVLVMIVSELVWGDIPLLRLFFNTFEQIGTESLLK